MARPGNGATGRRNNSIKLSEIVPQLPEELTHQAKLRKAVARHVSEADVGEVVQGIVARAKQGDAVAVKQFMQHLLGEGTPITFVQNNYQGGPEAESPAATVPGSREKIEHLSRRAANGFPLFNADDRKFGDED